MGALDTCKPQELRQDEKGGDEEQSLPGSRQDGGGNSLAHGLHHHVVHDDPSVQGEGDALEA